MKAFFYNITLHDKRDNRDLDLIEMCIDPDCTVTDGADLTAIGYAHSEADARRFAASDDLLKALEAWAFADADPAAARRKGYYDDAREKRDTLLRQLGSKAVRP